MKFLLKIFYFLKKLIKKKRHKSIKIQAVNSIILFIHKD